MAWKKSSSAAIKRFDEIVAVDGAKRGLLFGCPIYVLEGERYATLYQDRVVLRLPPADFAQLIAMGGRAFEPIKGRKSKNRVVVPDVSRRVRARCGRGCAGPSPTRAPGDCTRLGHGTCHRECHQAIAAARNLSHSDASTLSYG